MAHTSGGLLAVGPFGELGWAGGGFGAIGGTLALRPWGERDNPGRYVARRWAGRGSTLTLLDVGRGLLDSG